jgi:hypothetical protein
MREPVWPRCASAFIVGPSAVLWELPAPEACDYSRLSGVIPLRASRSAACQPLNLLCEAFAGRNLDSSGGAFFEMTLLDCVRHDRRPSQGGELACRKD